MSPTWNSVGSGNSDVFGAGLASVVAASRQQMIPRRSMVLKWRCLTVRCVFFFLYHMSSAQVFGAPISAANVLAIVRHLRGDSCFPPAAG